MMISHNKKLLRIIAVLTLSVILAALAFGCDKQEKRFEVNSKKTYYQYYFNTDTEKFEKVSNSYTFNDDGTFYFGYGSNDKKLSGTWKHGGGNYIEMSYAIENSDQIIETIMRNLGKDSQLTQSDIITLVSQIDFNDTMFSYKDCVFSTTNVQAYKLITSDPTLKEECDEVEGVYVVRSFEYLLYVSNGDIYSQDESNPQDNVFPIYRGSYRVVGDFIFLDFKNEKNGQVLANAVYYLGIVKLPEDLTIDEEEDDATMKYLAKWSGLEVRCWTNTLYSTKEVG